VQKVKCIREIHIQWQIKNYVCPNDFEKRNVEDNCNTLKSNRTAVYNICSHHHHHHQQHLSLWHGTEYGDKNCLNLVLSVNIDTK